MSLCMPNPRTPAYVGHVSGLKSSGRWCMASELRRCGSFCRMHVLKSLSLVW